MPKRVVTLSQLTMALAELVMGWRTTPTRLLTGGKGWKPRWKFQPSKNLKDANALVEAIAPQEFVVVSDSNGEHSVRIRVGGTVAHGWDRSLPIAICKAVALAVGIVVDLDEI